MGKKFELIGGLYSYEYVDVEKRWELVRYDEEAEEWKCTGVYCDRVLFADELANLLNAVRGKA